MRIFEEEQRFTQWWLQLIYLSLLGFIVFCGYSWYILKEPVGNVSSDDLLGQFMVIGILLLVISFFYILRLETTVNENGVYYRFFPFQIKRREVNWKDLEECYIRKYNPIIEYGGWGYRFGSKGKALNVKGNMGIQLQFKSGKKLLLGSQKSKEAQLAIERYFKK